jgi:DNA polymerase-3 subunit beta
VIKGSVTVQPQAFAAAVKWAAKFVSLKPAVPIQGGLLLDVDGGRMSILGYNESATARAIVPVDGPGVGQVVVSSRLLAALVATFPNKPVVISGHEEGEPLVTLSVGSWRGTLPVMTVGEFPSPPPAPPVIGKVIGDDIATAIRQAATARSDDEKQALVYHCLHLTFGEHQLTAMATNMYRAARSVIGFDPEGDAAGLTALVHGGPMLDVAESFAGPDEVWIGLNEGAIGLASPARAVILRQTAEPFPVEPVRKLFTVRHPEHALVKAADLQVPLKRAQLMREKDGPIRVRFTEGLITLVAAAELVHQDSDETVPAEYTGPDHELAFNPRYFGEALASAPGEVVDIALTTEKITGVVITVPGNEDWRHLLMPIKK